MVPAIEMLRGKAFTVRDEPAAYQLVGEIKAHQGEDGQLVLADGQPHWDCDTAQTPTGGSNQEFCAMDESLTQRRRVQDEGLRVVNCFSV